MSLRRPDIRDDVLGGNLAGETAIETGRRWALDEPATRAPCEINVFCTITDARGGGNSERGGRGGHSTRVTRPRLLVTLFRKCVEAVVLCGVLTLALVLPTRVTTAAAIVFWFFLFERADLASRRHRIMRACQRRYASPSLPSSPRSGFKQPPALMNGCPGCLSE